MNKKILRINKAFIIFFVFLNCSLSYAQKPAGSQKIITGSQKLPLEMNLLLESLQKDNPDNYKKILPLALNIDLYARSLSKEDIFMIGKIEIYKTLLKNYDAPLKQPIDGTSVAILRSALAKTKDRFIKWFLQALLQDSQVLIDNLIYKEYLLQKNSNIKNEKTDYRKLEKKTSLLQYWISKISPDEEDFPATLISILIPRMTEALKSVENSFYLLATQGSGMALGLPLQNESEFTFFAVKEVQPTPVQPTAQKTTEKSVEDILAPLDGTASASDLPKPTSENWLEDENTPSELKNLPIPSNDADWLQDF